MYWIYIGIFFIGVVSGFLLAAIFASGDRNGHIAHIFTKPDGTIDHVEHDVHDIVIIHEDKGGD